MKDRSFQHIKRWRRLQSTYVEDSKEDDDKKEIDTNKRQQLSRKEPNHNSKGKLIQKNERMMKRLREKNPTQNKYYTTGEAITRLWL